jgi:AcrR family transcriptional regulator
MPLQIDAAGHQRQRILDAMATLVSKRGYAATTIEGLSKAAGISPATFHKHFKSKEECFLAAFDEAVEEASRRVTAAAEEAGGGWEERVRTGLAALLEAIAGEPKLARMCLVESLTAGPAAMDRYERAIRVAVPPLRGGRQMSSDAEALPNALEETLVGGIAWTLQQRLASGDLDGLRNLEPQLLRVIFAPYLVQAKPRR